MAITMLPPALPADYELRELLGEGSFGWVYRALWRGSERAVKVFKSEHVNLAMVHRELEKLHAVKEHPGVVTVYDFDLVSGTPYYAMSLHAESTPGPDGTKVWRGRTLEDKVGHASPEEAVRLRADSLKAGHRWVASSGLG